MAGEAILVNIVTEILKKLSSLAIEEINLALGVKKEIKKLQETIDMIEAVISDAENKQVKEKSVGIWLKKLRDLAYDADDILDEYAYDIMHRCHGLDRKRDQVRNFVSFSSNPIVVSSKKGRKIKNLNQKFDELARQRVGLGLQIINATGSTSHTMGVDGSHGINRETYAFVDESKILGREVDKSKIISMLLANKSPSNQISVIPIVGMGGLGKTTLAQLVYNDKSIEEYFELKIWVCVSDDFDVQKLFIKIIESLPGAKFDVVSNLNVIVEKLQQLLGGKRFLLVLDDVWNENAAEWNKLKDPLVVGAEGSKILVTTRSETVARIVVSGEFLPYILSTLGEDICLPIFEQKAFGPLCRAIKTPSLMEIGKELVRKCGGLPLAVKALGSLMYLKEASQWEVIRDSKIWDSNPEDPLPALKLSYDYLSPQLKQCFSYCSMFPKDSYIYRETLIQLWVAEGFIQPSERDNNRLMEEIGNEYFHILLWNSFFQDVVRDDDVLGEIISCKMHDLVHDLAQSVVDTHECSIMEASEMGDVSKVRRLNLLNFDEESSATTVVSKSKLRTLFIKGGGIQRIVKDLFNGNKQLRVLDLSGNFNIEELPTSIGDLKHLRYLDLSWTRITKLPDSITRLYNLHTLKLNHCYELKKFPKDLNKLINLRHLCHERVPGLKYEVGQLTCLQALNNNKFDVAKVDDIGGIGQLQRLNLLGGKLEITGLERVRGREDAERANLKAKKYIQKLKLHWRERRGKDDSLVLEGLEPHPNLRSLEIEGFMGPKFPTWMSKPSCLQNLVNLQLENCNRCKQLPAALGVLQSLRKLKIRNMLLLEEWRLDQPLPIASSSRRFLEIDSMLHLEEWLDQPLPIASSSSTNPTSSYPSSLENITISDCPMLKSMPTMFPSLKEFYVQKASIGMGVISSIVGSNLNTLTKLSLRSVDGLKFLPQGLLKYNNIFESLEIGFCPHFRGFVQEEEEAVEDLLLSSTNNNSNLQKLELIDCPVLTLLPGDLNGLTSLRRLRIIRCGKSKDDHCKSIEMSDDCPMLKSMPTMFPYMEDLTLISCDGKIVTSILRSNLMDTLTELWLSNIPGLMFLPLGLLKANNVLRSLRVGDCPDFRGFVQEDEAVEDLLLSNSSSSSYLRILKIYNCPGLRLLPNLKDLTSLQDVTIKGCNEELVIVLPNGVKNRNW